MPDPNLRSECLRHEFSVPDYDLPATLTSGQTFRWLPFAGGWEGVVGRRYVRLSTDAAGINAETVEPVRDWDWLANYLQVGVDYASILETLPQDSVFQAALAYCRGLRILRQEPWECLASFMLSSTKRITQISCVIEKLCRQFGEPVGMPPGRPQRSAFPAAERVAKCGELELRQCGMGFRAPYLLQAARSIAEGRLDLETVWRLDIQSARKMLTSLPGVGPKIADCVLLFAYGFEAAFPVDVWVRKALKRLFFADRPVTARELVQFSQNHFGPFGGYAQQYLFHYVRSTDKVKGNN
jgi:N-glycosylase/DNA lyase